jgi:redox-sensitive bicupin YhaK (pirin superfamily)
MLTIRKANARGHADHGWLKSFHSFSFASYYDPNEQGFSDLRVINDDRVAPGRGFAEHAHRDMEIVSYVLQGTLEHKDSLGSSAQMNSGDVQLMSAGSGVLHSEYNPSRHEPVHFLQIWIVPNRLGGEPTYQQAHFSQAQKRGRLQLIVSPDGAAGSLPIRQETRIYAGLFDGSEQAQVHLQQPCHAYVHLARGSIELNGHPLQAGDGVRLREEPVLFLSKGEQAEVLVFELRPNELPGQPR